MAEASTQAFLEIEDIKEGVIVLKNKELRGVLLVSSQNFALKSAEEQTSIIYAFQNFLNTLDFPAQIIVNSRKLNITPYLDELKELENHQTNDLLKIQTASYREFIKELVAQQTIMTKQFFVVVPYTLQEALGVGIIKKKFKIPSLFNLFNPQKTKSEEEKLRIMNEENFQRCKTQLWQRMEFVAMGLKRCGLEAVPLTTPELIELFWAIHHPDEAEIGYYPEILPELLELK